jgi:hypothetical protein
MGMMVLGVAACTFLSTAYTLDLIFDHITIAVLLGGLWAAMTFFLDRSSLVVPRPTTKIRSLLVALPRFVLALAVGILISYPIQLRLFAPEIEKYAQINHAREAQPLDRRISVLQGQISELERQVKFVEGDVAVKLSDYLFEIQEREGSGRPGMGSLAMAKRKRYEDAVRDSRQLEAQISARMKELSGEVEILRRRRSEVLDRKPISFLTRMEAFTALRKQNDAVAWVSGLIITLFVLVSAAPSMVKLLRGPDLYEYVVESELREATEQNIPDLVRRSERLTRVMQSALADALNESRLNPKRQGVDL